MVLFPLPSSLSPITGLVLRNAAKVGKVAMAASSSSTSWACSRCTFLNPPSQRSSCQVCLSPSSPSAEGVYPPSSSSPSKWSCRACTFNNTPGRESCEICGTRFSSFSTSSNPVLGDDDDLVQDPSSDLDVAAVGGPPVGSIFRPLQRCGNKRGSKTVVRACDNEAGLGECCRPGKATRNEERISDGLNSKHCKILSYNVWFREDLELSKRMKALGDLLQQHSPDFICFQEVTPNIYKIFQGSNWWNEYKCSVSQEVAAQRAYFCMQMSKLPVKAFRCKPFGNSIMGRELCIADADVGMGKTVVIATSHLESPCPAPPKWDQMYSKERVAQAKESIKLLNCSPNVIFCGDMNWDDRLDGDFPLPAGWVDAWMELRPKENGWTYDTKSNPMLTGNRVLQKRLDRFMCNLEDFKIISIDMIGLEPIPGISYLKEKKVKGETKKLMLPILPSDHFGLLLTIQGM